MEVLRQHEIAEATHRILNPFSEEKLMLLGLVCRLQEGHELLDLACGKGELLCRWAQGFGVHGVGIDISDEFLAAARSRAQELGVAAHVRFDKRDASDAASLEGTFDVVSCLGASWIGGGLIGTIDLMRPHLRGGGLLLVGEPFWRESPPRNAYAALGCTPDDFASLGGTLDRCEAGQTELVEMVLADEDSWDRYVAAQWWNVAAWLQSHEHDQNDDVDSMREYLRNARRSYLTYGRRYLGWGVFVLRNR